MLSRETKQPRLEPIEPLMRANDVLLQIRGAGHEVDRVAINESMQRCMRPIHADIVPRLALFYLRWTSFLFAVRRLGLRFPEIHYEM